jgi:hypothetical protein
MSRIQYTKLNGATKQLGRPCTSTTARALSNQQKKKEDLETTYCADLFAKRDFVNAMKMYMTIFDTKPSVRTFGKNTRLCEIVAMQKVGKAAVGLYDTTGRAARRNTLGALAAPLTANEGVTVFNTSKRSLRDAKNYSVAVNLHEKYATELKEIEKELVQHKKMMDTTQDVSPGLSNKIKDLKVEESRITMAKTRTGIKNIVPQKMQYPPSTGPSNVLHNLEREIYSEFFIENTTNQSGDISALRRMPTKLYEFHAHLHALYPELLRVKARQNPAAYETMKAAKLQTRFSKSWVAAVAAEDHFGFDKEKEYNSRKNRFLEKYETQLARKRVNYVFDDEDNEDDKYDAQFYSGTDEKFHPREISQTAFWTLMKEMKHRFTFRLNDTICKLCDKAKATKIHDDKVNLRLSSALEEHALLTGKYKVAEEIVLHKKSSMSSAEYISNVVNGEKLRRDLTSLNRKVSSLTDLVRDSAKNLKKVEVHAEQFKTCRNRTKTLEKDLKPGEVLVYRDFVNTYTPTGKMMNLVLVCLWREVGESELQVLKLNHYCTDDKGTCDGTSGASAYYVADVWDYHLNTEKGSEFFKKFDTIWISGDHGPHFTAVSTVYDQSRWWERYGKKVHCVFLCSYHAFNRCDGAGTETLALAKRMRKLDQEVDEASVMAQLINESNYSNSVGIPFYKINMSASVFPHDLKGAAEKGVTENGKQKHKKGGLNLVKKCEMKYSYTDAGGHLVYSTPGIVLVRDVSEKDQTTVPYEVIQMQTQKHTEDVICTDCSNRNQRPVWHSSEPGECVSNLAGSGGAKAKQIMLRGGLQMPDPTRFTGVQLTKSRVKNKEDPNKQVGCNFETCGKMYGSFGTANNHMKQKHGLKNGHERLYILPDDLSKPFKCRFVDSCGNSCGKSYAKSGTANAHMRKKHFVAEDYELLYDNTMVKHPRAAEELELHGAEVVADAKPGAAEDLELHGVDLEVVADAKPGAAEDLELHGAEVVADVKPVKGAEGSEAKPAEDDSELTFMQLCSIKRAQNVATMKNCGFLPRPKPTETKNKTSDLDEDEDYADDDCDGDGEDDGAGHTESNHTLGSFRRNPDRGCKVLTDNMESSPPPNTPAFDIETNTVHIAAGFDDERQEKQLWFGIPLKSYEQNGEVRLNWLAFDERKKRYAITTAYHDIALGSILDTIENVEFVKDGTKFVTVNPFSPAMIAIATNALESFDALDALEGFEEEIAAVEEEVAASVSVSQKRKRDGDGDEGTVHSRGAALPGPKKRSIVSVSKKRKPAGDQADAADAVPTTRASKRRQKPELTREEKAYTALADIAAVAAKTVEWNSKNPGKVMSKKIWWSLR